MAVRKGGRKAVVVDSKVAAELTRVGARRAKAQDALEKAIDDLDGVISLAYMGGAPARQISILTGMSEKSVKVSLVRTGAVEG